MGAHVDHLLLHHSLSISCSDSLSDISGDISGDIFGIIILSSDLLALFFIIAGIAVRVAVRLDGGASLFSLRVPVPVVAVGGVDACVLAPVELTLVAASGIEDLAIGQAASILPGAGQSS